MIASALVRRPAARAVASFGLAQGIGALSGIVRIPLAVGTLGAHDFGRLSLFTAAFLWLSVLPNGARQTSRILTAEHDSDGPDENRISGSIRVADRWSHRIAVSGFAALIVLALVFRAETSFAETLATAALVLIMFGSQLPGSAALGVWEGRGKVVQTNLLVGAFALVSLALSALAYERTTSLPAWCIIFALPVVGPAWAAHVTSRFRRSPQESYRPGEILLARSSRILATQQLQNGLDPYIIAFAISATAAGQYNVASRLSIVLLLIPTALQPVLVKQFSERRADRSGRDLRARQRRLSVFMVGATSVLAVPFVVLSDQLSALMGAGVLDVPGSLFLAVALQCIVFAWQVPVLAALSGRDGTDLVSRTLPFVVAANLSLSALLVTQGVWGPTVASVVVAVGYHAWLHRKLSRSPGLLEGRHSD